MMQSTIDVEKRLSQLKKAVPTRGMERHPTVLQDVSELPSELKSPAVLDLAATEIIQNVISFPPQIQRGHHYVPKQALLFTPTDVIHILASIWPDQAPEVTHVKGNGLIYMEVTLILLYGFLEIVAQGSQTPTRLGMEFNLVAWDLLSRPIRQLLQAARTIDSGSSDGISFSSSAQPELDKLPLKFSNGLRIYGLLPGEQLEDLVFQPGIWERWMLLFRRAILPNTLVLLTSNYLVVIKEELGVSQGWIITYIPRHTIVGITNKPANKWNELAVHMEKGGQTVDQNILLTASTADAWRACWIKNGGLWQDSPDYSSETPNHA
jgi:hypothetical protein